MISQADGRVERQGRPPSIVGASLRGAFDASEHAVSRPGCRAARARVASAAGAQTALLEQTWRPVSHRQSGHVGGPDPGAGTAERRRTSDGCHGHGRLTHCDATNECRARALRAHPTAGAERTERRSKSTSRPAAASAIASSLLHSTSELPTVRLALGEPHCAPHPRRSQATCVATRPPHWFRPTPPAQDRALERAPRREGADG